MKDDASARGRERTLFRRRQSGEKLRKIRPTASLRRDPEQVRIRALDNDAEGRVDVLLAREKSAEILLGHSELKVSQKLYRCRSREVQSRIRFDELKYPAQKIIRRAHKSISESHFPSTSAGNPRRHRQSRITHAPAKNNEASLKLN